MIPASSSKVRPSKHFLIHKISISSPDCGPSNAHFNEDYTEWGTRRFPELKWEAAVPDVEQYLLIVENPDSPFSTPGTHGLYYGIPAHATQLKASDFEVVDEKEGVEKLRGPLKLGKNRKGTVYTGPRPLLGHGPHRYFYELIALNQPVDEGKLSSVLKKDELVAEIQRKVLGWGVWVGVYENTRGGFRPWVKKPDSQQK